MSARIEGKIIWINEKYSAVFKVLTELSEYPITCKCNHRDFHAIINAKIDGYAIENFDPKFGQQFVFLKLPMLEIDPSLDEATIKKSFQEALKGTRFGVTAAKRLYERIVSEGLGKNPFIVLQQMRVNDEFRHTVMGKLIQAKVINGEQVEKLLNWWSANQTKLYLQSIGLSVRKINSMTEFDKYHAMSKPFTLYLLDIQKCETLCRTFDIAYDQDDLLAGKIAREVNEYKKNFLWSCVPLSILSVKNVPKEVEQKLGEDHKIVIGEGRIAFRSLATVEKFLANWFLRKLSKPVRIWFDETTWKPHKSLSLEQKAAVLGAISNPVSIITGPAGTGKTVVIGEIVRILQQRDQSYVCCTYTGKATERLREELREINHEEQLAFTMHSLIARKRMIMNEFGNEKSYNDDDDEYEYVKENVPSFQTLPEKILNPNYIIIDESSMIYDHLLYELLITYPSIRHLILVGDPYQLQPFGSCGRPFLNLIASAKCPIFHLNSNFRSQGTILKNATLIRETPSNQIAPLVWNDYDYSRLTGGADRVLESVKSLADLGYVYRNKGVKILSPYKKEVQSLNAQCQQFFHAWNQNYVECGSKRFYPGDPVIMTENNYQIGVMNGEEGNITSINPDNNTVLVTFEDKERYFTHDNLKFYPEPDPKSPLRPINDKITSVSDLSLLDLAYALTVHRSQGSEYGIVILYLPRGDKSGKIINKNLIYTAATRPKTGFICIDMMDAFSEMLGVLPPIRYEIFPHYLSQAPANFVDYLDEEKSKGKLLIEQLLIKYQIAYISQYSHMNLPSLKYDFAFISKGQKYLLEFDGQQHFEHIDEFSPTPEHFLYRQSIDLLKTNFALTSGFRLIRIDYTCIDSVETHFRTALSSLSPDNPYYFSTPALYEYILEGSISPELFAQYVK